MTKKKEDLIENIVGEEKDKKALQSEVEDLLDKGKYKEARQLNEKIVAIDKVDDYFYFVASLLDNIKSQVITISGIKNILLFVDAINELKGIEDVIWEG